MVIQPAPGMPDKPITIAPRDDVGGNLRASTSYAGFHSYNDNLRSLLAEVDASEEKGRALRLTLVEKENFVEALEKRVKLIRQDIDGDKESLRALKSHVVAIQARIDRLKQEKLAAELAAQQHQYDAARKKLELEARNVKTVSDALSSRLAHLSETMHAKMQQESEEMQKSLSAHESGEGEGAAEATEASGEESGGGGEEGSAEGGGEEEASMLERERLPRFRYRKLRGL